MPRPLSYIALLPLTLALASTGCESSRAGAARPRRPNAPEPVAVRTAPAQVDQIPNVLGLDGTLAPKRSARLAPLVSGHVAEVRVERGDVVAEGAPLVILRATDMRLTARAASARAQAQFDQLGVEDTDDFDPDAVAEVVAARAEFERTSRASTTSSSPPRR
jgi:multidrug efflux pump subunit AcrA (membrane-fusion protein)